MKSFLMNVIILSALMWLVLVVFDLVGFLFHMWLSK